jgi:hypothetical protein
VESDDDNKHDSNYEEEGTLDEDLQRKIEILCIKCNKCKNAIKRLKMDLRLLKSHVRPTKLQIRIDYDWDSKEENFADLMSFFIKEWLFPGCKFLKDGWMECNGSLESLSLFVWKKVKIAKGVDYKDQRERVICPTIQLRYITIRCNLNNKVQNIYKSKCRQIRTLFFQYYLICFSLLNS